MNFCFRLPKIKEYVDANDPGAMIIPFSGAFEATLMDLPGEDERKAHCEEQKCYRYFIFTFARKMVCKRNFCATELVFTENFTREDKRRSRLTSVGYMPKKYQISSN